MLRTLEPFGSIHRGAIAAVAILLPLVAPAEGKAEPRHPPSPGLQQLWREFPLDSSRGSTPSRGRSIKPPDKIAPVAQAAATRPRARAKNVRQERALPVGRTPAKSEDTPSTWLQFVFIFALLLPIGILALHLGAAFVRRRRRVAGHSRHYTLGVSTDVAPDPARPGNEPLGHDPRRAGAFQPVRASDGRRVGAPRKPNAAQQSEVSKLKAKAKPLRDPAKQLAAIGSEAEVMRSKPWSETEAEFLQRKTGSHTGLSHEHDSSTETGLLKEKLASEKAISSAEPKQRLRTTASQYRLGSKLRALPDLKTGKEPPAERGRDLSQGALQCEIRWPRSAARSQFVAVVTKARGASREVASSPELSWRQSEPPPETSDTAEALRILVSKLVRDGWTVEGRGEDWYAIRLAAQATQERPEESSVRERDRPSERRPS